MLSISVFANAQKKTLQTKFTTEKITIDGKFDEPVWATAAISSDFVSFEPDNGNPEPKDRKTEVRIVYDNDAIYIAATMFDDPKKILKEFALRDNIGTADFFAVFINGFNDGQQEFRFIVSASNGQADCQASENDGEDFSWDAIWESQSLITDKGWVVEMKLPYAALRFSPAQKQTWSLNFMREVRRDRQKYTWTFIDKAKGTFIQQAGLLEGLENLKTPTRLFFLPYTSFYVDGDANNKTKGTLKGGMDIKYGINDAFTLDAVLIPDFGQTALDQRILNLGPFKQQFNENRSFFTEGTDLFKKGDLFYSRNIGGKPKLEIELDEDIEEEFSRPSATGLINATKISGRTKSGLGIGFLNAVTENTYAIVKNKIDGSTRKELIEPLANFNILVFDQRFGNNSSVSIINTNVIRNGNFRDSNVTGLIWDLKTKANTYSLNGNAEYSYVNDKINTDGFRGFLEFNKISGQYKYGFGSDLLTKNFDIDDLGFINQNNLYSAYGNANFTRLQPTKNFNFFSLQVQMYNQFNKETNKLQVNDIVLKTIMADKGNNYFGGGIAPQPFEVYDYYAPQKEGRFVILPANIGGFVFVSTNYNKRFAFDINPRFNLTTEKSRSSFSLELSPRFRFNDRFSLNYEFIYSHDKNDKGYTKKDNEDVIFARRDKLEYKNTLSGKYSINSQMNLNLKVIHYWSFTENFDYYLLNQNGRLDKYFNSVGNQNQDFSRWNFDLSYVWWFAPGSQISILYRNNSEINLKKLPVINKDGVSNVKSLLNNEVLSNSFSISIKYFIDYNQAKNWLK